MTMIKHPRDDNWFVVDKCQRLQESNQHPGLVRVFSIIGILTTIGLGSYFFLKLVVHNENQSSQLASMKTNITAIEEKIKNIGMEANLKTTEEKIKNNIALEKNIKSMEEKIKNIELDKGNLSSQLTSLKTKIEAIENTVLEQAKNISETVKRIHKIEADRANKNIVKRPEELTMLTNATRNASLEFNFLEKLRR